MKYVFVCLLAGVMITGCVGPKAVDFVYFNLSGTDIRVVGIVGMPSDITPGYLGPSHDENNPLEEKSTTFFEPIAVADQLKIVWEEGGVARELQLKRKDLGLPAKLEDAKVRFTYWGDGKWRVTRLR